jgi:hypothetical protein
MMRTVRLLLAASAASLLTVFTVLGMVQLVTALVPRLPPSPIVVSERLMDFGSIPINGYLTRELVVRNDGQGPLHTKFQIDGVSWRVDPQELILEPGVETSIRIEARPAREGRIDDYLTIQVVGGGMEAVVIPLQGAAAAAEPSPGWEKSRV